MRIYTTNYTRLQQILKRPLAELKPGDTMRLKAGGYMDLVVEVLGKRGAAIKVSLAHYFKQNGDLCQDPEMVVRVDREHRTVKALSFQQAIPPLSQEVYGNRDPSLEKHLNTFLGTWLRNLKMQGHRPRTPGVRIYTSAPTEYDYPYTTVIDPEVMVLEHRTVRLVEIETRVADCQIGRYESGLYFAEAPEEWEERRETYERIAA